MTVPGTSRTALEAMDRDLAGTLRILWSTGRVGGCDVVDARGAPVGTVVERLLVLPSTRAGRFLVSDAGHRSTARLLTGYNGIRMRGRAAQRSALAGVIRVGLPRRLIADRISLAVADATVDATAVSFPAHLRQVLGRPDALLALGVREIDHHHSKPTVQMFTGDGTPLAYAKLGWSVATAPLVRHETAALERLARRGPLPGVQPTLLRAVGEWAGHPYLVVDPLPAEVRSLPVGQVPSEAARAVAGPTSRAWVTDSPWWDDLVARVATIGAGGGALANEVGRAMSVLEHEGSGVEWEWGAWHGDWTWWNVGRSGGRIHAWDWEHSTDCAPVGFDDMHWSISRDKQMLGLSTREALEAVLRSPGVSRPGYGELFLLAYLTEMAVRSCEVSRSLGGEPTELHEGLLEALAGLAAAQH